MIKWHGKLAIGALGALCLSILKLISANFYLNTDQPEVALGAYLTFGGYLVLGMAVGFLFGEDYPEAPKTRKSAFLMGLLAPSILLAIISRPIGGKESDSGKTPEIPSIVGKVLNIVVPSAAAAPDFPGDARIESGIRAVKRSEAVPGFGDGVKSALGIDHNVTERYVYVVGKTPTSDSAKKAASSIEDMLKNSKEGKKLKVTVLKPEDQADYFVTVGDLDSKIFESSKKAASISKAVKESTIESFTKEPSSKNLAAAKLIEKGRIYKGEFLFDKAKN
jgi:hypothetical protein